MITKYEEYNKLIKCVLLLLIFYSVAFIINNYFKPFLLIVFFIFLCSPIYTILNKHLISNKRISALISIFFVNLLIISLLFFLGNFFFNKINNFVLKDYGTFARSIQDIFNQLSAKTKINFTDISEKIQNHYSSVLNNDFFKKGAVYTTDGIVTYFMGNMAAYFILVDKYDIFNTVSKVIPNDKYELLINKCVEIKKIMNIELILVLVTTLQTILGFWALNIKNALILGLVCGILDIIPVIGIILVFIPLILIEFAKKNYIIAVGLFILYILLQITRQIMEAKFMSSTLKIHPLIILISVYIGLKLSGILGVFLGPLYVISAKEMLKEI